MRGLRLQVYKHRGEDHSDGGLSSRCDDVTLVGVESDWGSQEPLAPEAQSEEATWNAPAVVLVKRFVGGRKSFYVRPADEVPSEQGTPWMAGGCHVGTSDSRWSDLTGHYGALPLHDRTETWAQYDAMSR